jgi:hypothetical protein
VADVDGWNFWGGPSYLRGQGYTWRDDHGRIEHVGFTELRDDGFAEELRWCTRREELLLSERRRVAARLVDGGWELRITTSLANTAGRPVRLGSPATNGRDDAGYGGLFWRLPPARTPRVRTADAEGERAVHGSTTPWLAWTDRAAAVTLVVTADDDTTADDPWFVRVDDYPGLGSQLAPRNPLTLPTGSTLTRGLRALLADGDLDDEVAATWAAGS